MSLNSFLKTHKGFSLLELLISLGIMGAVTMGVTGLITQMQKNQTKTLNRLDDIEIQRMISMTLLNKTSCENTLNSTNIGNDVPNIKNHLGSVLYTLNGEYSNQSLKITSMKTEDKAQAFSDGTRNVELVTKIQNLKDSTPNSIHEVRIPLRVVAINATAPITGCFENTTATIENANQSSCLANGGAWAAGACTLDKFVKTAGETMIGPLTMTAGKTFNGNLTGNNTGVLIGNITGNMLGGTIQGLLTSNTVTGGFARHTGAALFAGKMLGSSYCDKGGLNCKSAANLITAQSCGANQYMQGVNANGVAACVNIPTTSCGVGEYVTTVNPDGSLVCAPVPAASAFACPVDQALQSMSGGTPTCISNVASPWMANANHIYYTGGNVGLPTTDALFSVRSLSTGNTTGMLLMLTRAFADNTNTSAAKFDVHVLNSQSNMNVIGAYMSATAPEGQSGATDIMSLFASGQKTSNLTNFGEVRGAKILLSGGNAVATYDSIAGINSEFQVGSTNSSAASKVDTLYEINVASLNVSSGAGTIMRGNRYGVYLKQSGVGTTNNYAIYEGNSPPTWSIQNYFAGKVGINGKVVPQYELDVNGNIESTGCFNTSTGVLGGLCVSDERLKTDIHPFTLGLKTVLGLNPKYFTYNGKGGVPKTTKPELGLIAQNVENFAPELIKTKKVKLSTQDITPTTLKMVNYTTLPYLIINAIKELYAQFLADDKNVENKIAQLENERLELETHNSKIRYTNAKLREQNQKIGALLSLP